MHKMECLALWIIESPLIGRGAIAPKLLGNFESRLFGSWSSFLRLVRNCEASNKVGVVLVRLKQLGVNIEEIDTHLYQKFPSRLRLYLGNEDIVVGSQKEGRFVFPDSICPFKLSKKIKQLAWVGSEAAVVAFEDLSLNVETFELFLPSDQVLQLTMKEGLMLKYFMRNPGICFSRSHLRREVWRDLSVSSRTIDSQISRLRRHLEGSIVSIESIYRQGYVMR